MEQPIYPRRNGYRVGECGRQPIRDMERWVRGLPFHPYGRRASDPLDGETVEDAVDRCRYSPSLLKIDGELLDYRSTVEFWIRYRQVGDADSSGFGGPHPSSEDACYAALSLIEQHEREVYERDLVVGLA